MKRLIIWLAILLPLWVNAQTNGTIQKTSATGTIRGSFGSLGLDTLPRVTGALVDGYILKYHAATNKWYASPDPTSSLYWQRSGTTLSPLTANDSLNIGAGKLTAGKVLLGDTIPPSSFANERFLVSLTGDGQMEIGVTGKEAAFAAYNWNPINGASAGKMGVLGFHEGDLNPLTGNYFSEIHTTYYTGGVGNDFNVFKGGKDGVVFFPTSHVNTSEFIPNTVYIRGGDLNIGGHITTEGVTATGATGLGKFVFDTSPTLITPNIGMATGTSLITTGQLKGNKLISSNSAPEIDLEFDFNTNFKHSLVGSGYSSTAGLNQLDIKVASGSGTQVTPLILKGDNTATLPSLAGSGDVIASADNTGLLSKISVGSGLSLSAGILTATGGSSGSVTTAGGTAGIISKFTSASNIENSGLTESSGNLSTSGSMTASSFSGAGNGLTGTASSLNIGGNAATSTNSTQWNGYVNNFASDATVANWVAVYETSAGGFKRGTASVLQSFLGLGSNAYTSTAYAPLSSPTFTGTVSGITAAMVGAPSGSGTSSGTNTGDQNLAPYATLASPALTGNPTAPTQSAGDNSTKIATTAYVDGSINSVASSNTYTPTPSAGSNSVTITPRVHMYTIVGKIVTVYGAAVIDYTSDNTTTIFSITLPAGVGGGGFPNIYSATGSGVSMHTSNVERTVLIDAISSTSSVTISSTSPVTVGKQYEVKYSFMYKIN